MRKIYSKTIWLIISVIMTFLLTEVLVKGSMLMSSYIDLIASGNMETVDFNFELLALLVVLGFLFAFFKTFFSIKYSQECIYIIKSSLQEKVLYLKSTYFEENDSGSVINKLNSDITIIDDFFSFVLGSFLQATITVLVVGISIFKINFGVGIFVFVICLIILIFSAITSIKLQRLAELRRGLYDGLASTASDQLKGIQTIISYNALDRATLKVFDAIEDILQNEFIRIKLSKQSWFLQRFTAWFPSVVVPIFMLIMYLNGKITVGEITYLVLILNRLFTPFSELPAIFISIAESGVSLKRINGILQFEDELSEDSRRNNDINYDTKIVIDLKNIDFYYDEDFKALKNLNLTINKGESVAIIGGSGSGKSTIFKILCGFNKVKYGEYCLFGFNTNELSVDEIRHSYSIVSQEDFVINGTILENIKFGDKDATLEEVIEVCKKANIHEAIDGFENKYETIIGDGGRVLSGGERQRIAIARALLKKSPIMLLDEPTSALDVKNEKFMIDTLEKIKDEVTIVTIAHRLSTIMNYDKIVVMENGELVEMGTSKELLDKKGYFYKLKVAEEFGGDVIV